MSSEIKTFEVFYCSFSLRLWSGITILEYPKKNSPFEEIEIVSEESSSLCEKIAFAAGLFFILSIIIGCYTLMYANDSIPLWMGTAISVATCVILLGFSSYV